MCYICYICDTICFLGLNLNVIHHCHKCSWLKVFFQVTEKCLSLYPSRRKKPSSTKAKRKVSNPSFTVDLFLSTSSFCILPFLVPLTVTGYTCGGNSAARWLVTCSVCLENFHWTYFVTLQDVVKRRKFCLFFPFESQGLVLHPYLGPKFQITKADANAKLVHFLLNRSSSYGSLLPPILKWNENEII